MSLIELRDFTQRIADDILAGADTEEIALQKAEEIQEEIEDELKSRTEEIQAIIKDRKEQNALQDLKMKRRADRKDRAVYKIQSRNSHEIIKIVKADPYGGTSRSNLESINDAVIILDRLATPLDIDNELEYDVDDEEYLDQYTIIIDEKKAGFIGARDAEIIEQLKRMSTEMSVEDFVTFANEIKNMGIVRYRWSLEWIDTLIDLLIHYSVW